MKKCIDLKMGVIMNSFLKNSAEVLVCLLFVCLWLEEASFLFINFFVNKLSRQNFKPYEWNIWEIKFFPRQFQRQ